MASAWQALACGAIALWGTACGPVADLIGDRLGNGQATGTGDLVPAGTHVAIIYERRTDLALGDRTTTFRIEVEGEQLEAGEVVLPDGRREVLERVEVPSKTGFFAARLVHSVEGDEAEILARYPAGRYTLEITPVAGARTTVTVAAVGSLPPDPVPVFPLDQAVDFPLGSPLAWSGPFVRYNVALIDEEDGAAETLAVGTSDLTARPARPLGAGRAYTLEITARSGAALAVTEYRSTIVVRFTAAGA